MNDGSHKQSHYIVGSTGFGDAGEPVPVTWPPGLCGDADPEETGAALAALDGLRRCLVIILEGGHRDGTLARVAAVGLMAGLYANASEAARAIDVEPSTVIRALAKISAELLRNEPRFSSEVKCQSPSH